MLITRCPFCTVKIKLPDSAVGQSMSCPRCRNSFTAADGDQVDDTLVRRLVDAIPDPPEDPKGTATATSPAGQDEAEPARQKYLHPIGVLAVLCAGVGLLCASLSWLTWLTIPLGSIGVLLGIYGKISIAKKEGQLTAAAGGGFSAAVLLVALVFPSWLGSTWSISHRIVQADENKQFLVSKRGKKMEAIADASHWIDMRQGGIQQGPVRLQVLKAALCPPTVKDPAKTPSEKVLHIGVRIWNTGVGDRIAYRGWNRGGATLTDHRGQPRPAYEFPAGVEPIGQNTQAWIAPGEFLDDVLLFCAKVDKADFFHLELSCAAWSKNGSFRFKISAGDIHEGPLQEPGVTPWLPPGMKKL